MMRRSRFEIRDYKNLFIILCRTHQKSAHHYEDERKSDMYQRLKTCDACGEIIKEHAFRPKIIELDEDNRLTDIEWTELNGIHLCKYCASNLVDQIIKDAAQRTKKRKVKKPVEEKEVDKGMIDALHRAGWSYNDISWEMKLSIEEVCRYHHIYQKELMELGIK